MNKALENQTQLTGSERASDKAPLYYEDEVSLIDLLLILQKKKKSVFITFLLTILIAAGYLIYKQPVYESRAVIEVGQIGRLDHTDQIEDTAVLVRRLKEKYRVDDNTEGEVKFPRLETVSYEKQGAKQLVTLSTLGYSSEGTQKLLQQIVSELVEEHKVLLNSAVDQEKKLLISLRNNIAVLQKNIDALDQHINRVKNIDPAQAAILALEKGKISAEMPAHDRELATLEVALSPVKTKTTRVIRSPTKTIRPVKPKYLLVSMLAVGIGIISGVMMAFLMNIIDKIKLELETNKIEK